MELEAARAIMVRVRAHFGAGSKSGNKAYLPSDTDLDFDLEPAAPVTPAQFPDKADRRHRNAVYTSMCVDLLRSNNKTLTALQYGRLIFTTGVRYGNCTEMACVAAHLASDKPRTISIVTTDGSGDHAFCVVGPAAGWKDVRDPPADCGKSIVIDPWANLCCLVRDYDARFAAKMGKWLGEGKRIFTGGSDWAAPDEDYLEDFRAGGLTVINADSAILPQ